MPLAIPVAASITWRWWTNSNAPRKTRDVLAEKHGTAIRQLASRKKYMSSRYKPAVFLQFLAAFLLILSAGTTQGATSNEEKASANILAKGKRNEPQTLFVLFDYRDAMVKAEQRRLKKGVAVNDDEIEAETRHAFRDLREEVFPGGKFGPTSLVSLSDVVPVATVVISNERELQKILRHPKVMHVYEDREEKLFLSQSLPLINQPAVRTSGRTGAGTMIAVLDGHLHPYHPSLSVDEARGCKWSWQTFNAPTVGTPDCKISVYQYFGPAGQDNEATVNIYHGANVAGIALGVAPASRVAYLRVTAGPGNTAQTSYILKAMDWVIANAREKKIVAMNLSFGGGSYSSGTCDSSPYLPYVLRARDMGVVVVAASGNAGNANALPEPACVSGVMSVGSVYDSSFGSADWGVCKDSATRADLVPCSSNSSPALTILAPGSAITAGGTTSHGTSQAAPHVSGSVAVLKGTNAFPSDTVSTTMFRLTGSGVRITDPRTARATPRLNLQAALTFNPVQNPGSLLAVQEIVNFVILQ
jgi:subtilisin family serine protease